jgi:hypothetical protein
MDYECERGAKRNFEPWREAKLAEETEEERLDRLEREEAERDVMKELEQKTLDAKTEMAIADALDEVRTRNAQRERADVDGAITSVATGGKDEEAEKIEKEIEEQARLAFQSGTGEKIRRLSEEDEVNGVNGKAPVTNGPDDKAAMPTPHVPAPTFHRQVKKKKDFSAALGIKKKPSLV